MQPIPIAPSYLILDRSDPKNPRWVIAQATASLPADVPADADNPHRPTAWLETFDHTHFAWLTDHLGHPPSLRVPQTGRGCHATRIIPGDRVLLEHDRHGLGWYDGWDGTFHDTWTDPRHQPPTEARQLAHSFL